MSGGVVIAGAGQGGFQVAASLRSEGYEESITLIGDEPSLPYQRPPLSKSFMAGKQDVEASNLRPEPFYQEQRIDLLIGQRVIGVDTPNRRVLFTSGSQIHYRHLVLATGARNRLLKVPGARLGGVCYLRTRTEAIRIRGRLENARSIVILGGGFIGLELAAVASSLGKQVLVIECTERPMSRVVAPIISDYYRDLHQTRGVTFKFGVKAERFTSRGSRVSAVILNDGTTHPADLVLVGIGVVPNTELAQTCELPIANGIVVDDHMRTAEPGHLRHRRLRAPSQSLCRRPGAH